MVQKVKLLLLLAICLGLCATTCKAVAAVDSCQAIIKIPNYWAEGDRYAASINIALVNTGSTEWPAEVYNVTIFNPNLVSVKKSWGWSLNLMADGTAAGTMTLADALAPMAQADVGAVVSGTSPENFYPQEITFERIKCKLQQDNSLTAG